MKKVLFAGVFATVLTAFAADQTVTGVIAWPASSELYVRGLGPPDLIPHLAAYASGTPNPAARSAWRSGPRSEQQLASLPSITTAGTLRTPIRFARSATSRLRIS